MKKIADYRYDQIFGLVNLLVEIEEKGIPYTLFLLSDGWKVMEGTPEMLPQDAEDLELLGEGSDLAMALIKARVSVIDAIKRHMKEDIS